MAIPYADALRAQRAGRVGRRMVLQGNRYGGRARARAEVRAPYAYTREIADRVMVELGQTMFVRGDAVHRLDDTLAQRRTGTPTREVVDRRAHAVDRCVIERSGFDAI